jgi:putative protein kinase ArgK-like GTPase of G3E family
MEELVKDKNAFIRPSASGELGGVARKTRINQPLLKPVVLILL